MGANGETGRRADCIAGQNERERPKITISVNFLILCRLFLLLQDVAAQKDPAFQNLRPFVRSNRRNRRDLRV